MNQNHITIIVLFIIPKICIVNVWVYSLNKKEWICLLFKEWILEKSELEWIWSELGVNICVIHSFWSDHMDHSGIPSDPWGHSKMSEHWTQMFTPNSL